MFFFCAGLDREAIQAHLMRQAEEFSDEELLDGKSFGGIYADPATGEWIYALKHTDGMSRELGQNPTTTEINLWLTDLFANVKSSFSNLLDVKVGDEW